MKSFIPLAVLLLCCSLSSFAQIPGKDSLKNYYLRKFQEIDGKYVCREGDGKKALYVRSDALDSSFVGIFSTVILNNEDLIKNGNAGSIAQDKDKATLSFNYSMITKNLANVFNVGVYGNSSSSIVNIFSEKNWQNGVGLNFGYTWITNRNTRTFDPDTCDKIMQERNRFIIKKLREYYKIIDMSYDDSTAYRDILAAQDTLFNNPPVGSFTTPGEVTAHNRENSFKRLYDEVQQHIRLYEKIVNDKNGFRPAEYYDAIVNKEFTQFDIARATYIGYKVTWLSPTFSVGLGSTKIYNDTLRRNDSLVQFHKTDYVRAAIGISWNRSSFQRKWLYYISGGVSLFNTNFLENRSLSEIPHLVLDSATQKPVIRDEEGKTFGALNDYKKSIWSISPNFYLAWFFGKSKVLGLEFNARYNFLTNRPKEVKMPETFTTTLGILLRVNTKEVYSKATVGIVFGLINADETMKVWEEGFGAQLKIGVPFNTLLSLAK